MADESRKCGECGKKHPCPDCRSCQFCSDRRCELCQGWLINNDDRGGVTGDGRRDGDAPA